MKVGITGGRSGARPDQLETLRSKLFEVFATSLHHGDCVGADAQAHEIARELGLRIVVYPPDNPEYRAWCAGDEFWSPRPYLKRNYDIVDNTDLLIALPDRPECQRSGTWSTVRYARRLNKPVVVIS